MTRRKIKRKGERSRRRMTPFANFDAYAATSPVSTPTPTRLRLLRGCLQEECREVSISPVCYVNITKSTIYMMVCKRRSE